MGVDRESVATRAKSYRNSGADRQRAVWAVCSKATDAKDASELLAMLGLNPKEGR